MAKTKQQLTINDCNILDVFTLPKERKHRKVIGFGEFIDEDNGQNITLVEVSVELAKGGWHPVSTYWPFDTPIKEITKAK